VTADIQSLANPARVVFDSMLSAAFVEA